MLGVDLWRRILVFFLQPGQSYRVEGQPMASRPQVWDIFAAVQFFCAGGSSAIKGEGSQSQLRNLWDGNDQPESESKAGENYEGLPFHGLLRWGAQLYHGQWSPHSRTVGPWDLGFLESIHMIRAEVSNAFPILASS